MLIQVLLFTSGGEINPHVLTANKHPQRVKQEPVMTSKGTSRAPVGDEWGVFRGRRGGRSDPAFNLLCRCLRVNLRNQFLFQFPAIPNPNPPPFLCQTCACLSETMVSWVCFPLLLHIHVCARPPPMGLSF